MKINFFLLFILISFLSISQNNKKQITNYTIYKDWTVATGGNCGKVNYKCAGFNYAIVRTNNKIYNPQDGRYYYYYYIYFTSNSTYNGGGWAHTYLENVDFYLNGVKVYSAPYLLFKEKNNVCYMWHSTDKNALIYFEWKNIHVY